MFEWWRRNSATFLSYVYLRIVTVCCKDLYFIETSYFKSRTQPVPPASTIWSAVEVLDPKVCLRVSCWVSWSCCISCVCLCDLALYWQRQINEGCLVFNARVLNRGPRIWFKGLVGFALTFWLLLLLWLRPISNIYCNLSSWGVRNLH